MAIEHKLIVDAELHEPKGVAGASAGQVYSANGSGSGAWAVPLLMGIYDYNDLTTATTPITLTSAGTSYELTNDGAGVFTNLAYALAVEPNIWNVSTNRFDFTNLNIGDTVDIRLDIEWTTTGTNTDIEVDLELAVGGSAYIIPFESDRTIKASGSHRVMKFNSVYIGDANTKNNPARFLVKSDASGNSVKVNGWFVKVLHNG